MRKTLIAAALLILLTASPAAAQYYGGWGRGYRRGPSYGYGYRQRPATTRRQSYAYGLADVTRARSQANLTNAQALSTLSDVRGNEIRNNLDYTNMFFERRRINQEYRDSQRQPRATSEQLARYAADGMPTRASGSKIDSVTGEIAWPFALQAEAFAEYRAGLEQLFQQRAETGSMLGRDALIEARRLCDTMREELRAQVRELEPNEFIEARQFIDMLRYEARIGPN